MLALKILNGKSAGKVFQLGQGSTSFGRGDKVDVKIDENVISRQHFEIIVSGNKMAIQDLGSRNGTFVNGMMIKNSPLQVGDVISVNDLMIQVSYEQPRPKVQNPSTFGGPPIAHEHAVPQQSPIDGANALLDSANAPWGHTGGPTPQATASHDEEEHAEKNFVSMAQSYFEEVVMPGIYKLGEVAEFKWILGSFVLTFIVLVTILSTYPMIRIARDRVEAESMLRARDIASQLARRYQGALAQGISTSFQVIEDQKVGVLEALVISADDGSIIAPPTNFGTSRDLPFIHKARRIETPSVERVSSTQIGAAIPIKKLNPNTGDYQIHAYSVVLYDMGSRAIRNEDVINLFVQVMAIALAIGLILFAFMYRLIEYPISQLNKGIDESLKEGTSETSVKFNYPEFQRLVLNVNSALSRIDHSSGSQDLNPMSQVDPKQEAEGLVHVFDSPTIVINSEGNILALNNECESLIGSAGVDLVDQNISAINDQALQLNLQDLLEQVQRVGGVVTSELEFGGINYSLEAAAVHSISSVKYVVITFKSSMMDGGF